MYNDANTIYDVFIQQVQRFPDQIAILTSEQSLTYRELACRISLIANQIPDHKKWIGLLMDHSIDMIASIFAILKQGAAYIPAEPDFPCKRIEYMFKEAGVDLILTNRDHLPIDTSIPYRTVDTKSAVFSSTYSSDTKATPTDLAYILYTSGTTGHPKGVMIANANVCHYARAFEHEFHIGPNDIMLQYSVCSFDIFTEEVFATLLNGACLAIPNKKEKATIASLIDFIEKWKITIVSGFPYLLQKFNELPSIPSSIRLLISGGDVLRSSYIDHLIGHVTIYNTYGPSETTVCAAYFRCEKGNELQDDTYPIGRPVKDVQIKLLDPQLKEVPKGEIGEICIFGNGVGLGYTPGHEEENKMFVTLDDGTRMYRSGDLGYVLESGDLAFVHRKDKQVMILGKRVEPEEVENVLFQIAGIHQCVVMSFQDEQDLSYLVAYIVFEADPIPLSTIKTLLARSLTAFMIPEYFVQLKELPLNTNGKVDHTRLPIVLKEGSL